MTGVIVCQAARISADNSNAMLKWTICGVAQAGPASAARNSGLPATNVAGFFRTVGIGQKSLWHVASPPDPRFHGTSTGEHTRVSKTTIWNGGAAGLVTHLISER